MPNPDTVVQPTNTGILDKLNRAIGKGDNNPPPPTLEELKAMTAKDFFENHTLDTVVTLAHDEFKNESTDVSTAKARDIIIANAFKFSTLKTLFVGKANEQTAEWKRKTKEVNDKRDIFVTAMDNLRDETRKPVTEWDAKNTARENAHKAAFSELSQLSIILPTITSDELRERLVNLQPFKDRDWEEFTKDAAPKLIQVEEFLTSTLDLTVQAESDRAELAKMKADQAEKDREAAENQQRIDRINAAIRRLEPAHGYETAKSSLVQEMLTNLNDFYEANADETFEEFSRKAHETYSDTAGKYTDRHAAALKEESEAATAAATKRAEEIEQARLDGLAEAKRVADKATADKDAEHQKQLKNRRFIKGVLLEIASDIIKTSGIEPEQAMKIAIAIVKGKIRYTQIDLGK